MRTYDFVAATCRESTSLQHCNGAWQAFCGRFAFILRRIPNGLIQFTEHALQSHQGAGTRLGVARSSPWQYFIGCLHWRFLLAQNYFASNSWLMADASTARSPTVTEDMHATCHRV